VLTAWSRLPMSLNAIDDDDVDYCDEDDFYIDDDDDDFFDDSYC
jgi:hypothetical protein